MSKERLEEIRTRLKYGLGCLKHLRRELLNSDDESLKDQIRLLENDIKFLFEQAKRVQELEHKQYQDHSQEVLEGLYEQNKRYREAMKRAIDILKYVPSEKTPKKDAINALQDALKGE